MPLALTAAYLCAGGVGAQSAVAEVPSVRALAERPALRAIAGRPQLQIDIESPTPGTVLRDPGGMAFVSGRALARYGGAEAFDIVFVVDQSDSTARPSGGDVNGDGIVDRRLCRGAPPGLGIFALIAGLCRSAPDSIFAAELAAVRALTRQLDPRRTRVGLVVFSGDGVADTPDAFVGSTLTSDYASVERVLDAISELGPRGKTNIEAAIQVAANELVQSASVFTSMKEPAQRVILFLSDGVPTLPIDGAIRQNRRKAVEAALRASKARIRLDTFGIGSEALSQPETLVEMARVTTGSFTPVAEPRDLKPIFEQVNFAGIEVVRVLNRTNQTESRYTRLDADGTFSALLQAVPGDNRVEVFARASDGSQTTRKLTFNFEQVVTADSLPARLAEQREDLLATRLADLRQQNENILTESNERVRRDLQQRIVEARRKAEERARTVRIEEERAQ